MRTPVEVLVDAMRHGYTVRVIGGNPDFEVFGRVLHMTTEKAWMVVDDCDVFIALEDIETVETLPLIPHNMFKGNQ